MTHEQCEALVERIGSAILVNLCDRRGIRHALHDIDRDVMDEIRTTLGTIALAVADPVVREDEREGCIAATRKALNAYSRWQGAITPETLMAKIEPAIRARGAA